MRLIKITTDDRLVFTERFSRGYDIPPYAILSHTWEEGQEVTYDDWINGRAMSKKGYEKIWFVKRQCQLDDLCHFWIDTCCLRKEDPDEHCDALSSMFRWYQNAARCYVLLSDVLYGKRKADSCDDSDAHWIPSFEKSRWFTRGWTLQELLALESVKFFSRDWRRLGDKSSLEEYISKWTKIPPQALQGVPRSQFLVEDRISWSKHRQTQLPQDRAYSLMSTLGACISGESYNQGADRAWEELMEKSTKLEPNLRRIYPGDPREEGNRIEKTEGGLLPGTYNWIYSNAEFQRWQKYHDNQLLWIKGDPRKGKTMLLCGISSNLETSTTRARNLSYFFCRATDSRLNSATTVLRGLLYSLIQQPQIHLRIREKYFDTCLSLIDHVDPLESIIEIFIGVFEDLELQPTYLIIDGLDECTTGLKDLLDFIIYSTDSFGVNWIVSSRNSSDIQKQLELSIREKGMHIELNAKSVTAYVQSFIKDQVSELARQEKYTEQTRDAVILHLAANADNSFLWVALACKYLKQMPEKKVLEVLGTLLPELDTLYQQALQDIRQHPDFETFYRPLLAIVTVLYRPARLDELSTLMDSEDLTKEPDSVDRVMDVLRMFLALQGDVVYFVHHSARDFLAHSTSIFPSGQKDCHRTIYEHSIKTMSRVLRPNIHRLQGFGLSVEDAQQPDPDPLAASYYSCIYWIDHLCESIIMNPQRDPTELLDRSTFDKFFSAKFRPWLEALSLCKSIAHAILSMEKLRSLSEVWRRQRARES
jgi:hypothetical protein